MSERVSQLLKANLSEQMSRRNLLRRASLLGAAALVPPTINPAIEIAQKIRAAGGEDYNNDPFHDSVGAQIIGRQRLDNLLIDDTQSHALEITRTDIEEHEASGALAEFTFNPEAEGPIYAEFEGISDDKVALVLLETSIDDGEKFLTPLITTPGEPMTMPVQFGMHGPSDKPHRLTVKLHPDSAPTDPSNIILHLSQGPTNTLGHFINMHQPDVYLRNYEDATNNFPYGSFAFVRETEEELSVVYWNKCLDGDLEYGMFGTRLGQLVDTKNRPNDYDWVMEKFFRKTDGKLLRATYAAPYHRRVVYDFSDNDPTHTPIQIASANNNVVLATNDSILSQPKFRPTPMVLTHDERWHHLYTAEEAAIFYNMCENWHEGTLRFPRDQWILDYFDADIRNCA